MVERLKDIKDIVEVNDNSLEMLIALIISITIIALITIYFYKNRIKKRVKLSKKEIALNSLKSINFNNAKEVAYRFTTDGALWINDKNMEEFKEIEKELLKYKYKRDIPQFDRALETRVKSFIKGLK